jgi:hypothetical protein
MKSPEGGRAGPQHPIAQNVEGEARHYQKAAAKPNQPQGLEGSRSSINPHVMNGRVDR